MSGTVPNAWHRALYKTTLYGRCNYCHILQINLMRCRDNGELSRGLRASKSHSRDLNSIFLDPELMFLTTSHSAILGM